LLGDAIGREEVIGAKFGGDIIACVRVEFIGSKVAKFGTLSVSPDFEGNGIGGLLVKAAENYAISRSCNKMRLELLTSTEWEHKGKQELHIWYSRLGYKFVTQFPFEEIAAQEAKSLRTPCFFNLYEKRLNA